MSKPKARKPAKRPRTAAVVTRERAVGGREDSANLRDDAADLRDKTASQRDAAAGVRDDAADVRDETATLREDAIRAREEAARARTEALQLMAQMREANANLVVGAVRAQTLSDDAEQANHLKDEFLATVSHELRTPLNAILGWARMLAAKQLPSDRTDRGIATIERNAAALAHIIEDLLDVSRIAAGTLRLVPSSVDLLAVAESALEAVRPLVAARSIDLTFVPDRSAIQPVSGDADRLVQVLWNLLGNAIKFTSEGGRVDLSIERSGDRMEIRVADTGRGITPDFLPHVFDRFRQADGTPTRRHSGLGLGLALVRQLVELHGGTVQAASQGVGFGSTFTVCLPIAIRTQVGRAARAGLRGDRRTAAASASPMPRLPRLDALRIVVVDDDADGRTLTSLVLSQAGAIVRVAATAGEALHMLEAEEPDILVSDIGLPDVDGYALIRHIRRREAEHGGFLPVIALTGYARAEDRHRIIAAGFQAHVTKPVDPAELTAAIAAVAIAPPSSGQGR